MVIMLGVQSCSSFLWHAVLLTVLNITPPPTQFSERICQLVMFCYYSQTQQFTLHGIYLTGRYRVVSFSKAEMRQKHFDHKRIMEDHDQWRGEFNEMGSYIGYLFTMGTISHLFESHSQSPRTETLDTTMVSQTEDWMSEPLTLKRLL